MLYYRWYSFQNFVDNRKDDCNYVNDSKVNIIKIYERME